MQQLSLFPVEKQIPQWLADHFHKANAGTYCYKQEFYSKIKHNVLKKYGEFAGYDLQIIEKKCWSCEGTGVYKKYYLESGKQYLLGKEHCWNCNGTGIYLTKRISLERYLLNGIIYHIPTDWPVLEAYKNEVKGLIQHEHVDPEEAYKSFLILAWRYDKAFFYSKAKEFAETKILWVAEFIQSLFRRDNTLDDLPF